MANRKPKTLLSYFNKPPSLKKESCDDRSLNVPFCQPLKKSVSLTSPNETSPDLHMRKSKLQRNQADDENSNSPISMASESRKRRKRIVDSDDDSDTDGIGAKASEPAASHDSDMSDGEADDACLSVLEETTGGGPLTNRADKENTEDEDGEESLEAIKAAYQGRSKATKRKSDYTPSTTPSRKRSVPNKEQESTTDHVVTLAESPPGPTTPAASKFNNQEKQTPKLASAGTRTTPFSSHRTTPANAVPVGISNRSKSFLDSFSASPSTSHSLAAEDSDCKFKHVAYEFLHDGKRKDMEKRLHTDPEYDPRTLYVPDAFVKQQTPGHRQWWELKMRHFDTILFFKVGKFYELYHMDAVDAVRECNLTYMKGDYAHCGFPEMAYGRYSDLLVSRGYKVARVEQTETPQMLENRQKTPGSTKDKVVRRELCRITTPGTQTHSFIDGADHGSSPSYLLAVCEKGESKGPARTFGVCFVDTAIGAFKVGQFMDDTHCSLLRSLVAHYPPAQILFERNKLSPGLQSFFKTGLTGLLKEGLNSKSQFWTAEDTLKALSSGGYFDKGDSADQVGPLHKDWPTCLAEMRDEGDSLGLASKKGSELALRSLGAIIWYLKQCLIDHDLISMRVFEKYVPIGSSHAEPQTSGDQQTKLPKYMVLDAMTLQNLDIVCNSNNPNSVEGTLLQRLDLCATAFGKRLFRHWLCNPLCDPVGIKRRQEVVSYLHKSPSFMRESFTLLKKLPDIERLLQKIHTLGSKCRATDHPDSRAVFFDNGNFNKRKIADFLLTIEGLKTISQIVHLFPHEHCTSSLLTSCLCSEKNGGRFPDISGDLDHFLQSFNHAKAKEDGVIIPEKGVDKDYDDCEANMARVQADIDDYLADQKKLFRSFKISYVGTGRNRYQLELPDELVKHITNEYDFKSQRKGFKRYTTATTEQLLADMTAAEEAREKIMNDITRRIFASFDNHFPKWKSAVDCISIFDVLMSFARYVQTIDGTHCAPEVVQPNDVKKPFIEIKNGTHPCANRLYSTGDFIPNDAYIGTTDSGNWPKDSSIMLLTGPNMGGKSTLMRQISMIVVMAQMGCLVPAEVCRLTPVDRLFTRLGARDKIMAGQSTFYVELDECSAILRHSSAHSLVLMDELGRGTATHDGTAIASAVLRFLADQIGCRTLFSTHYHSLVDTFSGHDNIALGHMACMVENENEDDPSQETVTFLYKLAPGACPKSYGFHAAKLAGLPNEIIKAAFIKSKEFEGSTVNCRNFQRICDATKTGDEAGIAQALEQLAI